MKIPLSKEELENNTILLLRIGSDEKNYEILKLLSEKEETTFNDIIQNSGLTKGPVSMRLNVLSGQGYINWNRGNGFRGPGLITLTELGRAFLQLVTSLSNEIGRNMNTIIGENTPT